MKVDIVVNAQRFENYGGATPYFKPKGGQTFIFPVDDDFLFNDKDKIVEAIDYILGVISNDVEKYTYISHHTEFAKPIVNENLEGTFDLIFGEAK